MVVTKAMGIDDEAREPEPPVKSDLPASVTTRSEGGAVEISDEVVAVVTGLAATKVDGIAGMSGGLVGDISAMLGRKNLAKGVKVEIDGEHVSVDLHVIVDYGVKIPSVAEEVQQKVKSAVEGMTGFHLAEVNIHVQGVAFAGEVPAGNSD